LKSPPQTTLLICTHPVTILYRSPHRESPTINTVVPDRDMVPFGIKVDASGNLYSVRPVLMRVGFHENRNRFSFFFSDSKKNPTLRFTFRSKNSFLKSDSSLFLFPIVSESEINVYFRLGICRKSSVENQCT
jgi:hypothetical protein